MKVENFMSKTAVTVTPEASLASVWKLLNRKNIHGVPVVDKRKTLLGMISKEDILKKLFPRLEDISEMDLEEDLDVEDKLAKLKKMTAERVMNKRVLYARPDSLVMRALSRMIIHKVRQLPVLDDDDHIVGMISKGDIFKGVFSKK